MSAIDQRDRREFRSRGELRGWLADHCETAESFWLVTYKIHVGKYHIPYGDVVEELLCFGWVDSRSRRLDDDRTMLLVAERKPGSTWSASNKRRVAKLAKEGLIAPKGQEKIDAARKDGSWRFLDDVENLVIPADLKRALTKYDHALENFNRFQDSAKKIILLWIKTAKKPDTRKNRISETARLASKNIKAAHPEAKGQ